MLPSIHLISAILISVILAFFFQWWQILLFFLAAIFIDVDHYIYFIYKKRSANLSKAYNYFYNLNKILAKRKNQLELLMIFHNLEFLIILFILTLFSFPIFFPILFGVLVHYSLDFIALLTCKENNKKYKRAFSLFCYIIKNAKKS